MPAGSNLGMWRGATGLFMQHYLLQATVVERGVSCKMQVDAAARLLVTLISAHGGGAALLARSLSVMTAGALPHSSFAVLLRLPCRRASAGHHAASACASCLH
jgi:hypothetical protein